MNQSRCGLAHFTQGINDIFHRYSLQRIFGDLGLANNAAYRNDYDVLPGRKTLDTGGIEQIAPYGREVLMPLGDLCRISRNSYDSMATLQSFCDHMCPYFAGRSVDENIQCCVSVFRAISGAADKQRHNQ